MFADAYQIAAIAVAVPSISATVWAVLKFGRRMGTVHEAIIGRPETAINDKIPSMIERFRSVNEHLERQDIHTAQIDAKLIVIEGQFHMNGGGTVKDDLVTVKDLLNERTGRFDQIELDIAHVASDVADTAEIVAARLEEARTQTAADVNQEAREVAVRLALEAQQPTASTTSDLVAEEAREVAAELKRTAEMHESGS